MRAVAVRPLRTLNKSLLFSPAFIPPYAGRGTCASPRYLQLRHSAPALPFVLGVLRENSLSSLQHLLSHNMGDAEWQLKLNLLCSWQVLGSTISPRNNETVRVTKLKKKNKQNNINFREVQCVKCMPMACLQLH